MATRAQLSQERSRLRRDELLAAAMELFAEGGARAVTHRAVAARAGLPSATTTYYFESIDQLIREALASHVTRWIQELDKLAALDPQSEVNLDRTAGLVSAVFARRGPEIAAVQLSIFLAAAREPRLRDLANTVVESLEGLMATLLGRAGVADAEQVSAGIAALIGGTALRRQSGRYTEDEEALLLTKAIRDLVAAQLLGSEVMDRAIAGLRDDAS
ncbi:MAG: TetR family transcriptional regulator [Aeromicrobium sp.]